MNDEQRLLFDAAVAVQARAHVPYSKYHVGCALITDDGSLFAGANIENAAYPQGWCAEASAIAAMASAGHRRIRTLLTIGPGRELATCCGGCRQKIREFADADTRVISTCADGLMAIYTMDELLPDSFGPENLDVVADE
jgi:cytidine deaminase